MNAYYIIIIYK